MLKLNQFLGENHKFVAETYFSIGSHNQRTKQYEKALENYFQAAKINEKVK